MLSSVLTLVLILIAIAHSLPASLKIGIVISEQEKDGPLEFGYKFGLHVLNRDSALMPNTSLESTTIYVKPGDTFRASKRVCHLLESGVIGILGSASESDPSLEWKLFWMSSALDIPLFFSSPSYLPNRETEKKPEFAIRNAPSMNHWNSLLRDIGTHLKWKSLPTGIAILYEDERGLVKMQSILRDPVMLEHVIVRRVAPETFTSVLAEVQNREIRQILIDCKLTTLPNLLEAILAHGMTDYKYHYILTNLDLATVNMTSYIQSNVNLTAFQIVNQGSKYLREKFQELKTYGDGDIYSFYDKGSPSILTDTALAFDSVMALGSALSTLDASHTLQPTNVSCEREIPMTDGLSLLNFLNSVDFKGLSGPVTFKEGERSSIRVDIVRLGPKGFNKVGVWTPDKHLNITNPKSFWDNGTNNITLVVTSVLESPFFIIRPEANLTGNDRFGGFSIDLLRVIAGHVGFKYVIEIVPDGKYGVYDHESGEWNGVVRQLLDKRVDLAIGSMTINYARESVIDFTKPFMNLGISILFKVPTRQPARLFSFLNPLGFEIWISCVVSYFLVSITMFFVARFSPHEWSASTAIITHTKGSKTAVGLVRNQFTISNAFWYPVGTLMQQGSDLNPKTTSTRLIGGIWWFFSLVIVSSYTANLAAFLTVERMSTPIESAEDLAEQSEIAYGTLESGSTMTFFRDSKIETFQKMWRFMESRKPSVFVSTYEEGIQRVLDGNYAFLMESTMLDYVVQQNCNLTQIGGLLDSKGYGIATPIGSPWRDKISLAILEMQESGFIQALYHKWWRSPGMGDCPNKIKISDLTKASALGVDSIGGVFVVLLVGLSIAILVAVLEFCWHSKVNANSDQVALCSEMAEEARFAFRCRGPRRRPALTRHCVKCHDDDKVHHIPQFHDSHTYPHVHHINGMHN